MDISRLLFLIFVVIPSECSEMVGPTCEEMDVDRFNVLEGEAFCLVPYALPESFDKNITWYKNHSRIFTNESEKVFFHGGDLCLLDLHPEDSGLYIARYEMSQSECWNFPVKIEVFNATQSNNSALLYGRIKNSDQNKKVPCPTHVIKICERFQGAFSWKKDDKPLHGRNEPNLRIPNAQKNDQGIYTCICTWSHNNKESKTSGSRRMIIEDQPAHPEPEIICPTDEEERFAEEGEEIKLNCSIRCQTHKESDCRASWDVKQKDGYSQTNTIPTKQSYSMISTAILTIHKVSAQDFQTTFECKGEGSYKFVKARLTFKRRESAIPLIIRGVIVLLVFLFAAMVVKYFAIDLALFFKPFFPLSSHSKDTRMYDAFVVYQMRNMDPVTDDLLYQFVTNYLPSVLEEKCGYRLFIQGRDDIPGEDRLELVESHMKQSRSLILILTPGSGSETTELSVLPENSAIGGFDWQVGVHYVLVRREMSVILIQLGNTGPEGYTHLAPGLQHLIRKNPPIRWPGGKHGAPAWNSRFWKRVRYLMPATPAKQCSQAAII